VKLVPVVRCYCCGRWSEPYEPTWVQVPVRPRRRRRLDGRGFDLDGPGRTRRALSLPDGWTFLWKGYAGYQERCPECTKADNRFPGEGAAR
jgi:hypothetical protein